MANINFCNNSITTCAGLIAEYADESCEEVVKEALQENFRELTEAENFINKLFKNGVVVCNEDKHFVEQLLHILVDIASNPFEREFLQNLALELKKKGLSPLFFGKGSEPNPFGISLFGLGQGSCAGEISFLARTFHVNLLLTPRVYAPLRDSKGKDLLEPLPYRRVLIHELIHIFHMVTGNHEHYVKLPEIRRWTNGLEQMAITGKGGNYVEKYTENSFAQNRGEKERVAHPGDQGPMQDVFATALHLGMADDFIDKWEIEEINFQIKIEMLASALKEEGIFIESPALLSLAQEFKTKAKYMEAKGAVDISELPFFRFKVVWMHPPIFEGTEDNKVTCFKRLIGALRGCGYDNKARELERAFFPTSAHRRGADEISSLIASYSGGQPGVRLEVKKKWDQECAAEEFVSGIIGDSVFVSPVVPLLVDIARTHIGREFLSAYASQVKTFDVDVDLHQEMTLFKDEGDLVFITPFSMKQKLIAKMLKVYPGKEFTEKQLMGSGEERLETQHKIPGNYSELSPIEQLRIAFKVGANGTVMHRFYGGFLIKRLINETPLTSSFSEAEKKKKFQTFQEDDPYVDYTLDLSLIDQMTDEEVFANVHHLDGEDSGSRRLLISLVIEKYLKETNNPQRIERLNVLKAERDKKLDDLSKGFKEIRIQMAQLLASLGIPRE